MYGPTLVWPPSRGSEGHADSEDRLHVETPERGPSSPIVNPAWLFLAAGLAILGLVMILPAYEDLAEARFRRDRALAVEAHRESRLARYEEFLGAIENRDPSLVMSLAATQLNQIPTERAALPLGSAVVSGAGGDASVFPSLEPEPMVLPERERIPTRLERLVTGERTRGWVLLVGAVCVLVGLLPATRSKAP